MTEPPDAPRGIGTPPSAGHPSFEPASGPPPSGAPSPDPVGVPSPARPVADPPSAPPAGWAPPRPDTLVAPAHARSVQVAPPPTGRRPGPRPRRRVVVGAALGAGLLMVGVISMLPLAGTSVPGTQPALVTASPSPAGTALTPVSGGDLGRAVAFSTPGGSGTITVNRAVWTDAGELAAPPGDRYLVLDVAVACDRGEVPVSPVAFVLVSGPARHASAFGEKLTTPLAGGSLRPGRTASGQLGFALAPGPATLELLDENLRPLASVAIPGP